MHPRCHTEGQIHASQLPLQKLRLTDDAPAQVIQETAVKMGLTPEDDFILRVVQLSELLAIRHCVFLMGPTGSGRSECYKVLAKAIQTGSAKPVNTYLEATNRKKVEQSSSPADPECKSSEDGLSLQW